MRTEHRTRLAILALGGLLLIAGGARGQGYGLQVAESAESRDATAADLTVGVVLNEDFVFYGVRETVGVRDDLRVFLDLGMADPNDDDRDLAAQAGALYALPVDVPVDLGVRMAVYGMGGDWKDVIGMNLLLLASREVMFEDLYVYGGVGLDAENVDTEAAGTSESEVNGMGVVGALMPMSWLSKHLFGYAEVTVTDNSFVGFGLRYR